MILQDKIKIKWNSKNYKKYKDLGYKYTKMGDEFEIKIEELSPYSKFKIKVQCDYCGKIFDTDWRTARKSFYNGEKICCLNPECTGAKAAEILNNKYGESSPLKIEHIKDKMKQTNLERYGCENVFQSDKIKNKIKQTNMEKYGFEYATQSESVKEKTKNTCMKKYGVPYFILKDWNGADHRKEKSPKWKGGVKYHRVERSTLEYREWRMAVFKRDNFVCQKCHKKSKKLRAHHILNWKDNIECRYDVDNGITFCEDCHIKFHSKYGKRNNNKEQLYEFLNED